MLAGLGDLKPRLQLTSVDRIDHALSQELVGLVVLTIAGFTAIAAFAIFDPATAVAVDLALTVPGLRAVSKRRTFGMRWVLGCLIGLALGRLS